VEVLFQEVRSTDTIIKIILEQSTSLLIEQTQQSKSLCHLMEMLEVLIEGMNLILHQLDTIHSCLPPPRDDFAQLHHPTQMTEKLGKSTITQSIAPATKTQMTAVSSPVNQLPQTDAPPGHRLDLSNPQNHPSQNQIMSSQENCPDQIPCHQPTFCSITNQGLSSPALM